MRDAPRRLLNLLARFGRQPALLKTVSAAGLAASCVLPQEQSESDLAGFTFFFDVPLAVPVAAVYEPPIAIGAGADVLTRHHRLESENAAIVAVDSSGLQVIGISRGTAAVRATVVGGATGRAVLDTTFTVRVTVAGVAVEQQVDTLFELGDTTRLLAAAFDADQAPLSGVGFSWASSDATVVVVDASGLITAVGEGTTTVTASVDDAVGEAEITVFQDIVDVQIAPDSIMLATVGRIHQFAAVAFDRQRNVVERAVFAWGSGDVGVANVDSSGRALAVGPGVTDITVKLSGFSDRAIVVVDPVVAFVFVTPRADTLGAIGDTTRLVPAALDSGSTTIRKPQFQWLTSDSSVVVVDETGLVTAVGSGTAVITVTAGDVSARATVTVDPPPTAPIPGATPLVNPTTMPSKPRVRTA